MACGAFYSMWKRGGVAGQAKVLSGWRPETGHFLFGFLVIPFNKPFFGKKLNPPRGFEQSAPSNKVRPIAKLNCHF